MSQYVPLGCPRHDEAFLVRKVTGAETQGERFDGGAIADRPQKRPPECLQRGRQLPQLLPGQESGRPERHIHHRFGRLLIEPPQAFGLSLIQKARAVLVVSHPKCWADGGHLHILCSQCLHCAGLNTMERVHQDSPRIRAAQEGSHKDLKDWMCEILCSQGVYGHITQSGGRDTRQKVKHNILCTCGRRVSSEETWGERDRERERERVDLQ